MKAGISYPCLVALAIASLSCSVPRTRYYTMEIPHSSPTAATGIGRHIAVQRFRADTPLSDDRVVYRENPDEVNFYEYHRWASAPADLVTSYFIHRLKDSGTYSGVSDYRDGPQSDFILQGRLHRFEEVDRGKEVFAHVALELELLETKTRASVWRREADCTRPLATRDVGGVVRGLYSCLDEIGTSLLATMQKQVESARN